MKDIYDDLVKIGVRSGNVPVNEVYTKDRYGSEEAARNAFIRDTTEEPPETGSESAWQREVRELRKWNEDRGGKPAEKKADKPKSAIQVAITLIQDPQQVSSISQRLSPQGKKSLRKALITISQRAEALMQNNEINDQASV